MVAPPAAGEVRPIMDASTAPIDTDATAPKLPSASSGNALRLPLP